jgi:hypothetical protein
MGNTQWKNREVKTMKDDPKIHAFLANALAHGIKTGVTNEGLDQYCLGLVEFLSNHEVPAWAKGDSDGILITDMHDEAIMIIFPKAAITTFRLLGELDNFDNKERNEIICRVVLLTVGWTAHFAPAERVIPAGGLTPGGKKEQTFKFKDDGFGIV